MTNQEAQQHNQYQELWYDKLWNRLEFKIAIRGGVAAALSWSLGVGFAHLLDRPNILVSGTWCVLSTFVVLQAHLGGTYRAAWVRFLGVLIGSFTGGLFTSLLGSSPIILGFSVVFTVLACSLFQLKESIRIACLSLTIVMILWGVNPDVSPWIFGLYRFLDSTLGVLIAVIVSHTLWPTQASQKMYLNISKILHQLNRLFELELSLKPTPKNFDRIHKKLLKDITQLIIETRHFLEDSELELLRTTRNIEEWENLIDNLETIFESTTALKVFQETKIRSILDKKLIDQLTNTMETCASTFKELSVVLKSGTIKEQQTDLKKAVEELNAELTRFRMTRTTRKFERHDVEQFFVFFYNLRTIIQELLKIKEKIHKLIG